MANNKNKGTGFAAPTIGNVVPDGAVLKKNANGRIVVVQPKPNKKKTSNKK